MKHYRVIFFWVKEYDRSGFFFDSHRLGPRNYMVPIFYRNLFASSGSTEMDFRFMCKTFLDAF